jgi:hypothetical protein
MTANVAIMPASRTPDNSVSFITTPSEEPRATDLPSWIAEAGDDWEGLAAVVTGFRDALKKRFVSRPAIDAVMATNTNVLGHR